jgi:hypothetical protein
MRSAKNALRIDSEREIIAFMPSFAGAARQVLLEQG